MAQDKGKRYQPVRADITTPNGALTELKASTGAYMEVLRRLRPRLERYAQGSGLAATVVYDVDRALEPADGTPAAIWDELNELLPT